MQRIYFFFILFAFGHALQHVGTHLKSKVSHSTVHEFVHKHSHNSSVKQCPNFENKMKNATQETSECIHKHYDPEHHSTCHFLLNNWKPCTAPITSLLKDCLPPKSKDTPEFIVDSFLAFFKYVCHAKGSELIELSHPCITHTLSNSENPCNGEIENELIKYQKEFPSKAEICSFETTHRKCLANLLDGSCESSVTKRIFFKFYDSLREPCKTVKY